MEKNKIAVYLKKIYIYIDFDNITIHFVNCNNGVERHSGFSVKFKRFPV